MYRHLTKTLKSWKNESEPKPLLIRGARQVGKSYLVESFGKTDFKNIVTINFETDKEFKEHFATLNPSNIIDKIFLLRQEKVELGSSLLFLDEIQECPEAIASLRYFQEKMPGLHVIAAGSLLDFVLNSKDVSVPVGRIHYLYMEPMTFNEYLLATDKVALSQYIDQLNLESDFDSSVHNKLIEEFKNYLILGGMPAAIKAYLQSNHSFPQAFREHNSIIETYRDDFKKYSKQSEQRYLKKIFNAIPYQLSRKFKYSVVDSEMKSRDLKDALNLLIDANICKKIKKTSPKSLPLEVLSSERHFKSIFLDCGLAQNILGTGIDHIVAGEFHSSAAGGIAEQYVGQELLATIDPYCYRNLYYWQNESRNASAEIDYLITIKNQAIPIEVKSGTNRNFKSMRIFMKEFDLDLGLKISTNPLEYKNGLLSIPFYMVNQLDRVLRTVL